MSLHILDDASDVLRFQHERITKNLFKKFLVILEDVESEHNTALGKLYNSLPEAYKPFVELADYLDEDKVKALRKKVLDSGGDACRELDALVDQFNIKLK